MLTKNHYPSCSVSCSSSYFQSELACCKHTPWDPVVILRKKKKNLYLTLTCISFRKSIPFNSLLFLSLTSYWVDVIEIFCFQVAGCFKGGVFFANKTMIQNNLISMSCFERRFLWEYVLRIIWLANNSDFQFRIHWGMEWISSRVYCGISCRE